MLSLSSIYIDKEIDAFINHIKKEYSDVKEHEFEIRFSESGKNSISLDLFNKLLGKCLQMYSLKKEDNLKYKTSSVKIYTMKNGALVTEFRKIKTEDETICQIKNGKEKLDRVYSGQDKSLYTIRYSSSRETPMTCPSTEDKEATKQLSIKKVLERKRKRFEYDTGKGYTYMFTQVKENESEEIKYEFEIEYVICQLSSELIKDSLWIVMNLFQSNLTIDVVKEMTKNFFTPFDKDVRPPKPENITAKASENLKRLKYTVTNKLDGERFLLFFWEGCVYARQNDKIVYITKCHPNLNFSVVDAEFFKGKFYFFDCYMFQNQPYHRDTLDSRILMAETIAKTNPDLFVMKKFYKNLPEASKELLDTLNKDENDGLIYTPERISPDSPVYKWKFPEKMSIDFRVILVNKIGEKYKYYLCVYTSTDKKGETPFDKDEYISDVELENKKIYEFMYDVKTNTFVLHRQRPDKVLPNFVTVANSVFKDMEHPFESYKLLELFRPMNKFRKYHNSIKRDMIKDYCGDKTIIDLGIGRGGDIDKYVKVHSKKVFGIEPYEKNYLQLLERFPQYTTAKPAFIDLIKTPAQNTQLIVAKVGVSGVDIVTSFFSLSFFFFPDTPDDLQKLVETISQNLKEGGYFIGTTIDGEKTKALLDPLPDKTFNFGDGSILLNADNTVSFEIKGTIVETQLESLVNFKRLKDTLESVGIEYMPSSSYFFTDNKELSQAENRLNGLYRKFVFKKHRLTSQVNELCNTNKLSDLLTRIEDEKCILLYDNVFKNKVTMFRVHPRDVYNALKEFILTKRYINAIDSPHLIKTISITGNRSSKVVFRQKIPETSVSLREYKKTENYEVLREQLLETFHVLQAAKIDYGSLTLDGLLVNEEIDGNIQILFHDYSKMTQGEKKTTDHENLPALLEFLK